MAVAALAGSLDERTIRVLASATSRPSCVDAGGVPEQVASGFDVRIGIRRVDG
jgi:hypothetical protein